MTFAHENWVDSALGMFALRVEVLGFDAPGWMDSNTTVLFESALLLCLFYPLFLFLLPSFMPTHTHCPCRGESPSYGWQLVASR
jgi:hypothetical protein